jgi:hypothetical protein
VQRTPGGGISRPQVDIRFHLPAQVEYNAPRWTLANIHLVRWTLANIHLIRWTLANIHLARWTLAI